jgi:hypothetical protein
MAKAKLGKALATKLKDFIDEMKDKYAMTPDQTKSAIRNYANEGYLPKDPKRILPGDDERLALMITTNTILPNRKAEFMQDWHDQRWFAKRHCIFIQGQRQRSCYRRIYQSW